MDSKSKVLNIQSFFARNVPFFVAILIADPFPEKRCFQTNQENIKVLKNAENLNFEHKISLCLKCLLDYRLESACLHIVYVDAVSCLHIVYVDATTCLHIVQVICCLVIT